MELTNMKKKKAKQTWEAERFFKL